MINNDQEKEARGQPERNISVFLDIDLELMSLLIRARLTDTSIENSAFANFDPTKDRIESLPENLYLNDLNLTSLPRNFGGHSIFQSICEIALDHNNLSELPFSFTVNMPNLQTLTLHDNDFFSLPSLQNLTRLTSLRLDRNKNLTSVPKLPLNLTVLHLGGCSLLPGTYEQPSMLPKTVLDLYEVLEDCMLPDGTFMGKHFGNPLPSPFKF